MTDKGECDLTVTFSGFAPMTTFPLAIEYSAFPPYLGYGQIDEEDPVTTDANGDATVLLASSVPNTYYIARSAGYSSQTIFCSE